MKAKVLAKFRDKYSGEVHEVGTVIELTKERFDEIEETAESFGTHFVEEVKQKTSPRRGKKPEQ